MTTNYINDIAKQILDHFRNAHPGQPVKTTVILSPLQKAHLMDYRKAVNVYIMLLFGNMLKEEDGWVGLTEYGYQKMQEKGEFDILIYLPCMINLEYPKREQIFYDLWDIIGDGDKETNPFYCNGSDYYKCIKDAIDGLPPTYTQYMKDIEQVSGRKVSRTEWYKDLFMKLKDVQIEPFLKVLSELLNKKYVEKTETSAVVENTIETNDMRKPKIFISHNSDDNDFAFALVEMMHSFGVKYEDIFCSSHPACKIPFGKSILDTIAAQFNEYELIVLFVHSPRLYKSHVSLNEMGAAWILKKECYSFLTKDCSFTELDGVIDSRVIAFKAGQEDTYANLHDFEDMLYKVFNLERQGGPAAEYIRNKFINDVSK